MFAGVITLSPPISRDMGLAFRSGQDQCYTSGVWSDLLKDFTLSRMSEITNLATTPIPSDREQEWDSGLNAFKGESSTPSRICSLSQAEPCD